MSKKDEWTKAGSSYLVALLTSMMIKNVLNTLRILYLSF